MPPSETATSAAPMLDQGKFNKQETTYLTSEWLARYMAHCVELDSCAEGIRETKGVKGNKGAWSDSIVYPAFVAKFYPPGEGKERPNAQSLKSKLSRWLSNAWTCALKKDGESSAAWGSVKPPVHTAPKAPRATNAVALFAKGSSKVKEKMNEKRIEDGETVQQANLKNYRLYGQKLFNNLPDDRKAEYKSLAQAHNTAVRGKPPVEHIYSNQESIDVATMQALQALIGDDWGQHGRAVFFVIGAYQDWADKLQTFNVSVGPVDAQVPPCYDSIGAETYKTCICPQFKVWANGVIPGVNFAENPGTTSALGMGPVQDDDGFPLLLEANISNTGPGHMTVMISEYITSAWDHAMQGTSQAVPICWDLLHSAESHSKLIKHPKATASFSSLDPSRMTMDKSYYFYKLVFAAQSSQLHLLEFQLDVTILSSTSTPNCSPAPLEHDIEELLLSPLAAQHNSGSERDPGPPGGGKPGAKPVSAAGEDSNRDSGKPVSPVPIKQNPLKKRKRKENLDVDVPSNPPEAPPRRSLRKQSEPSEKSQPVDMAQKAEGRAAKKPKPSWEERDKDGNVVR